MEGVENRFKSHLAESRTCSERAKDRWIRKHGERNIRFTVLEAGLKTSEEVKEAEVKWVSEMRTFGTPRGLNMTRGGEGVWGLKFSEKTRARFRERTAEQFSVKHPRAIITESDVLRIIDRIWSGETSPDIARDYQVSSSSIQKIRDGVNWSHLPRPKGPPPPRTQYHRGNLFSLEKAQELLNDYRSEKPTLRTLAGRYGISEATASAVINRRRKYQVLE